jgi:outer membrane protease
MTVSFKSQTGYGRYCCEDCKNVAQVTTPYDYTVGIQINIHVDINSDNNLARSVSLGFVITRVIWIAI